MKRLLILGLVALALVPASTASVSANPGHGRPRVTLLRWQDPPVTAADPACEDLDCHEEILIVKAHDNDSAITEVQVWFGEGAPFVFAHTGCVQGKQAGTVARLEIGVSYLAAGDYTVQAVAYSHKRCLPHVRGDGHPEQHSPIAILETTVQPAVP